MKPVRCAIYARKSSEEGLDQAFNSLDAQREACEAYVASQRGEGWSALKTTYADGGFSGGSMERPALRRLLADVEARKVDVVVVYKVDRLTRSLPDFARIVDVLDRAGASFVSVTQAFNTTTSMGRLTLNVLLSFAQFEREVTGERIRDKIAASKKRGMWMGGCPPLGYDLPTDKATKALVVNPAEAEVVRLIFSRYLELKSVNALTQWLGTQQLLSKAFVSAKGKPSGGQPFNRGALFHLLKNRVYLGDIIHKGAVVHEGAHPAIIDRATFDAAQTVMAANRVTRGERLSSPTRSPLRGLLFDADGEPMSPSFTSRGDGRVYRYYVSAPLQQGRRYPQDDAIRRIPAAAIEELLLKAVTRLFRLDKESSWTAVRSLLARVEVDRWSIVLLVKSCALAAGAGVPHEQLQRLSKLLRDGEQASLDSAAGGLLRVVLPVRMQVRGGRTWLTGGEPAGASRPNATLIKGLRAGHKLMSTLGARPFAPPSDGRPIAAPANVYEHRLLQLAYLAPDIQQAIVEGRQPADLNLERLINIALPEAWADQRQLLGFTA